MARSFSMSFWCGSSESCDAARASDLGAWGRSSGVPSGRTKDSMARVDVCPDFENV